VQSTSFSKPEIVAGCFAQGVNSIMGGGLSRSIRLQKASSVALIFCLMSVFFLSLLTFSAMAGTETGEFCPTCPDWTDLDGWLAKKEAYELAQQNGGQSDSQTASLPNGSTSSSSATIARTESLQNGYVMLKLITSPASIKSNQVILDVRTGQDYLSGHIPGARSLYWKDLQRNGILNQAQAREALSSVGVNESDQLLVYGDSSDGAAFVFWALCYLGQKNVSLLDGGVDAVRDGKVALTTNAPSPRPSNYTAHIVTWLLVTPENLESKLKLPDVQVLDARDFSEYGQSRLCNESICLSQDKLYENSKIKDAGTLKDLFGRRLDKSRTTIVYGTPQAYSLFYSLKLMGYNASLLEGDWWKETKWAVSNVKS
jgi:thiosulfate/3-mercaptopyruvate sulfurtransferase